MNITDFLLPIAVASSFGSNSGNSDNNDKSDISKNNDECFVVDKTDMEENLNYMISDRDFSKINENAINELRVNYSLNQDTYIKYRRKRIEACIYAVCLALLIIALAVEWFCISDNSVKAIATISLTVISIVFRVLMVVSDKRISQFFEEEDENGNFNGNCLYGLTSEQMDHIFKYRCKTFDELLTFEFYSSLAYESGYVKITHIKADKIIFIELSGKKTSQIRLAYDEITFYFLSDTKDIQNGLLIDIIDSGKWDETAVKKQIAAFGKAQEQARYYRMQYFFNLSKILTPEQKAQVKSDLAQEMQQQ